MRPCAHVDVDVGPGGVEGPIRVWRWRVRSGKAVGGRGGRDARACAEEVGRCAARRTKPQLVDAMRRVDLIDDVVVLC